MTKQAYLDMCEMLGSEPVESEIPIEFSDFPQEIQEVFQIYNLLQDNWDYVNGNYLGKYTGSIQDIFALFEVPQEQKLYFLQIIASIDSVRREEYAQHKQASASTAKQ